MTIGQGWSLNRFLRLKGYLWMRYLRYRDGRGPGHQEDNPRTYNRYVRLVMALEKRQKEAMC